MSIRTFNKLFNNKGCVGTVSGVLLLVMVISLGGRCNGPAGQPQPDEQGANTVVATVGEYPVTDSAIEKGYEDELQQMSQFFGDKAPDPGMEATMYGSAIRQQIAAGLTLVEATDKHIPITNDDLIKSAQQQFDDNLRQERQQLVQSGKLKSGSDADFNAAYKAATEKTPDQARKDVIDQFTEALKDKTVKAQATVFLARTIVPKILGTRIKPTDQELKDSFSTLQVKSILFTGADAKAQVAKAQEELKGGSSFESVEDKYTKAPKPKGKKASELESTLTQDQTREPEYAPLLKLKAGEVSPPIDTPSGTTIYKVIKLGSDLPKDFDKTKETLRDQLAQKLGTAEFQTDLDKLEKTVKVTWKDPSWHALYDVSRIGIASTADQHKQLEDIIKAADTKTKPGALANYAAVEVLSKDPKADKAAIDNQMIQAISAVSEFAPDAKLQLELADIFERKKDAAGLAQALTTAASMNHDYTPMGQALYVQIQTVAHKNEGLLPPDAQKSIAAAQAEWTSAKAQQDKDQAMAAKVQADQAKTMAVDKKKYEQAQKEQAAKDTKAAKGPPAPATNKK